MLSNVMVLGGFNLGFTHQKEEKAKWGIHRTALHLAKRTFHKIKHEVQEENMLNFNSDALTGRLNESTGYL